MRHFGSGVSLFLISSSEARGARVGWGCGGGGEIERQLRSVPDDEPLSSSGHAPPPSVAHQPWKEKNQSPASIPFLVTAHGAVRLSRGCGTVDTDDDGVNPSSVARPWQRLGRHQRRRRRRRRKSDARGRIDRTASTTPISGRIAMTTTQDLLILIQIALELY